VLGGQQLTQPLRLVAACAAIVRAGAAVIAALNAEIVVLHKT
jgi:hypothetical protein